MNTRYLSYERYTALCEAYRSGVNSGAVWRDAEEKALLKFFDSAGDYDLGTLLAILAHNHQRSVHAVTCRLKQNKRIVVNALGAIQRTIHTEETNQENTMSAPTNNNFQKKELVLIRGKDAATMSDDEIFNLVGELKAQINHLHNMRVESTKITKRIGELNDDIASLIMYVDNR